MPYFRKKPVVIEASRYKGPIRVPDGHPLPPAPEGVEWGVVDQTMDLYPFVRTLEGRMFVAPGDWIITGIKGERYPCKPDIFDATYEEVPAPERRRGEG